MLKSAKHCTLCRMLEEREGEKEREREREGGGGRRKRERERGSVCFGRAGNG